MESATFLVLYGAAGEGVLSERVDSSVERWVLHDSSNPTKEYFTAKFPSVLQGCSIMVSILSLKFSWTNQEFHGFEIQLSSTIRKKQNTDFLGTEEKQGWLSTLRLHGLLPAGSAVVGGEGSAAGSLV